MKSLIKSALSTVLFGALVSGVSFAEVAPDASDAQRVSATVSAEEFVDINVFVFYVNDDGTEGEPVAGVFVFDKESNQLYGHTDDNGRISVTVPIGSSLRIVEPIYGVQQHVTEPATKPKEEPVGWKRPN